MVTRLKHRGLVVVLLLAVIIACAAAGGLLYLNTTDNPTSKFLLPEGFTGWVEVTYEQPGSPALKKEGRTIIYEVPPSGEVITSSKNDTGTMVLSYVAQDGRLIDLPMDVPMIHGQGTSSGTITGPDGQMEKVSEKLRFFVGTVEQWRKAQENETSP